MAAVLVLAVLALVLLSRGVGTSWIVRKALAVANERIPGTVAVETVDGSILHRLRLGDVVVTDHAGLPVLTAERIEFGYRLLDLLRGRITIRPLIVDRPTIELVRNDVGEDFTFMRVLPTASDGQKSSAGPPVVVLEETVIRRGSVLIEVFGDEGEFLQRRTHKPSAQPHGEPTVRRVVIDEIEAEIPSARLTSTHPSGPRGIDLRRLAASVSHPALTIENASLDAEFSRDTLRITSLEVDTRHSRVEIDGWLGFESDGSVAGFDVEIDTITIDTDELKHISSFVPGGLLLNGTVTTRSRDGDRVVLDIGSMTLVAPADGGALQASGGVTFSRLGLAGIHNGTSVSARRFDLAHVENLVDSGLLHKVRVGTLDGLLRASGLRDSLDVQLEAVVRSSDRGEVLAAFDVDGRLTIMDTVPVGFERVALRQMTINLGALTRAGDSMPSRGDVDFRGIVTGHLFAPTFTGRVIYAPPGMNPSVANGTVAFSDLNSLPAFDVDVVMDSLQLEMVDPVRSDWALRGMMRGQLEAGGTLDSTSFELELAGTSGELRVAGLIARRNDAWVLDTMFLEARDLNANELTPRSVATRLTGELSVDNLYLSGLSAPRGSVTGSLRNSAIAGVALDSARAEWILDQEHVTLDLLRVVGPGISLSADGGLGIGSGRMDSLVTQVAIDSLRVLAPLLSLSSDMNDSIDMAGQVRLDVTLEGTTDAFEMNAGLRASELAWGDLMSASAVDAAARWERRTGTLDFEATVDSFRLGAARFTDWTTAIDGSGDQWEWVGTANMMEAGQWQARGSVIHDSMTYTVSVDSLGLALWRSSWVADPHARLMVHDDGSVSSSVTLQRQDAAGRISLDGVLRTSDTATVNLVVEGLPVGDALRLADIDVGPLTGVANVRGTLDGREDAFPGYRVAAEVAELQVDTIELPNAHIELESIDARTLGTVTVQQDDEVLLTAEANLPAFFARGRDGADSLSMTIRAENVPASLFDPFLPAVRGVMGLVKGSVAVSGTVDRPTMEGQLEVEDGEMEFTGLGTRYTAMTGDIRFVADTVYIDSLSVTDEGDGTALANGFVHLPRLDHLVAQIDIEASHLLAMDNAQYTGVRLSGRTRLGGAILATELTGDLSLESGILRVDDVLEKQVIDLEDSLFGTFVDTMVLREQQLGNPLVDRFLDGLSIDGLQLDIGSDVWIRSVEGNIQVSGDLVVNKVGDEYPTTGTLDVVRGTYEMVFGPAVARAFSVTGGEIQYFGTDSLDAVIDISASHSVRTIRGEEITVFVNIAGTMRRPTVTLSSDRRPPIPETEIISYLIFGAPSVQVFVGEGGRERRSVFERGAGQFSQLLAGRLEQSIAGIVDHVSLAPGDPGEGFSETEIFVGKQLELFGHPSFVTFSPRLCPKQPLSGIRSVGLSIETWLSQRWLLDVSLDPRRACGASTVSNATDYQVGMDLLWVIR